MVWAMIIFTCIGHTNSVCWPELSTFETRAQCVEAMTVRRRGRNWWTGEASGEVTITFRHNAICLPLSEAPITGSELKGK